MRLRQITLAAVALGAICLGICVQRLGERVPIRGSLSAGPKQPDLPAPKNAKLVHIPGLARPAASRPIVDEVAPGPRVHVTPQKVHRLQARPANGRAKPSGTEVVPQDTAETPPPPLEPPAITNVQVSALTSSSVRITWQTNVPAQEQTAFGLDAPTVWTAPSSASRIDHESVIDGLEFSTTYTAWVHAVDEWNRAQTANVTFTTGPMLDASQGRTSGTSIFVDDRPFFPIAVWEQCSDMFHSNIQDGINLFMGDGCREDTTLPGRLAGSAYSIVDSEHANATGRGVIGWYFPDEWDAFLQSNVKREDLADDIPSVRPGRVSFLTLTNHFYSKAEPLPQGKGMYPVLFQIPDVLGFDLYPLQVWCRPAVGDVFDAQRELRDTSGGKPTFQWIEVARMEHPCRDHLDLDPTPATVRAEAWLSIGGGATGIGYFPNQWSGPIGQEVTRTNREIKALTQALLAPIVPATADNGTVRVSARSLNGALYVIAVNTSTSAVQARINVPGIAGRSASVLGGGAAVASDDQGFSDSFGPLAARVYIVPPAGW